MPKAMPRPGRKCAKGHAMDPSWESCPYCEAERRGGVVFPAEGAAEARTAQPETVAKQAARSTSDPPAPPVAHNQAKQKPRPGVSQIAPGHVVPRPSPGQAAASETWLSNSHIFISSTSKDLEDYRQATFKAIQLFG